MFPLHIPAIAMTGGMLLSKRSNLLPKTGISRYQKTPAARNSFKNPLEIIFKNLASSLPKARKETPDEIYYAAIRKFIPPDAKIIVPKFPLKSKAIQIADIDGDSQNEVIASYRYSGEIKTIIIKKQDKQWYKLGEISHPGHDKINYRNTVNITEDGSKQLLLGLSSEGNASKLYGYTFRNRNIIELFSRNYHKFELFKLRRPGSKNSYNFQLAFWDRKDSDTYNIEVLSFKNSELIPADSPDEYYYRNVVPFYLGRVKMAPYAASNWYNLANVLVKSRAFRDAKIAVDIGTRMDTNSVFAERFLAINNEISGA